MAKSGALRANPADLLKSDERKAVELFSKKQSVGEIASSIGVTDHQARNILHSATLILSANDGLIDDYLLLLDEWEKATGQELFVPSPPPKDSYALQDAEAERLWGKGSSANRHSELGVDPALGANSESLERLGGEFCPRVIRELASSLLRLADCLDQGRSADRLKDPLSAPSTVEEIMRNSDRLAYTARSILSQNQIRKKLFSNNLFGDPGWYMLLELFVQYLEGTKISSKSLTISADCPPTTALRYVGLLEEAGLVTRTSSTDDRRFTLVELTQEGFFAVGSFLEKVA